MNIETIVNKMDQCLGISEDDCEFLTNIAKNYGDLSSVVNHKNLQPEITAILCKWYCQPEPQLDQLSFIILRKQIYSDTAIFESYERAEQKAKQDLLSSLGLTDQVAPKVVQEQKQGIVSVFVRRLYTVLNIYLFVLMIPAGYMILKASWADLPFVLVTWAVPTVPAMIINYMMTGQVTGQLSKE